MSINGLCPSSLIDTGAVTTNLVTFLGLGLIEGSEQHESVCVCKMLSPLPESVYLLAKISC